MPERKYSGASGISLGLIFVIFLILIGVSICIGICAVVVVINFNILKNIFKTFWEGFHKLFHEIFSYCSSTWKNFLNFEVDENAWWVKFVKISKIPGLKDAIKPGLSVFKRIAWLVFVSATTLIATYWIANLSIEITNNPTILKPNAEKVPGHSVPFPTVIIGHEGNFKKERVNEIIRLSKFAYINGEETDSSNVTWISEDVDVLESLANQLCNNNGGDWESQSYLSKPNWKPFGKSSPTVDEVDHNSTNQNILQVANYIKASRQPCLDMLKACFWGGKKIDCASWTEVQTDMGAGCGFNTIPLQNLRKDESIQNFLTDDTYCANDAVIIEKWASEGGSISRPQRRSPGCISTSNPHQNTIPLIQPSPGKHFGLSYITEFDRTNLTCFASRTLGHHLEITGFFEDSSMTRKAIFIPHNHDVSLELETRIINARPEIGYYYTPIERHCYFPRETKGILKYYQLYSETNCQKECLSDATFEECKCSLITYPKKPGSRLCVSEDDMKCVIRMQGTKVDCRKCLPTCSEVVYKISHYSQIPYTNETMPEIIAENTTPGKATSRVTIYFKDAFHFGYTRQNAYDWIELIGLIGGVIGLTNGLSFIDGGRITDAIVALIPTILLAISSTFLFKNVNKTHGTYKQKLIGIKHKERPFQRPISPVTTSPAKMIVNWHKEMETSETNSKNKSLITEHFERKSEIHESIFQKPKGDCTKCTLWTMRYQSSKVAPLTPLEMESVEDEDFTFETVILTPTQIQVTPEIKS